jgi:MFS family permease
MSATRIVSTSGRGVLAKRRGYYLTAGLLLVIMLGGTLPIPLYVLYEKQLGFGPLGVTVVFAAYVIGTLPALVAFGDLSDHIGRRKVLAVAVVCAAVSTALLLAASGIGLLIVARIVSGLAAGFATGTATAALADLQPHGDRQAAAMMATGTNMTGLGLGPLIAGLFAAYVANPTCSVFWAYLGVCALALAAVAVIPRAGPQSRPRSQDPSPPGRSARPAGRDDRGMPRRVRRLQHPRDLQQPGAHLPARNPRRAEPGPDRRGVLPDLHRRGGQPGGVRAAASPPERGHWIAVALGCLAMLEAALFAKALWLFLAATVIGGVAVGLVFRSGLSEINRLAEPRHRAGVVSTFFAAAYLGLGLPAVLTGLISQLAGTVDASAYTSGLVAAIVLVAFAVVRRTYGTAPAPRRDSHHQREVPVGPVRNHA